MRRRGFFLLLLFNIIISVGAAAAYINFFAPDPTPQEIQVPFEVVVTATPDPNYTPPVIILTATPDPDLPPRADIPDDVREGTVVAQADDTETEVAPIINENGSIDADALPEGCIQHTLVEGEFPSLLAQEYDVNLFTLLAINDLDDESSTLLDIGDILIIPLEGCPVDQLLPPTDIPPPTTEGGEEPDETDDSSDNTADNIDATPDENVTPSVTPTPTETPIPTVTLAPTAANAQIEIVDVEGIGDITTEGVVIRNNGNTTDISGWTLSDSDGNTYVFPEGRRLFSGASVTVNTRGGENTAILFFWGLDEAVFGDSASGSEVVVLANRDGEVQASLRLSG